MAAPGDGPGASPVPSWPPRAWPAAVTAPTVPAARTVVIAATGDPSPPAAAAGLETVARDIGDQVYERLADLAPGGAPIDETAYRPALAARWERVDSLTWRFHLRPGARWQDGRPVTAEDVRFSFEAFADSVIDAPARALPHRRHRGARGFGHGPRPLRRRRPRSSSTTPRSTSASSRATSGRRAAERRWAADTSVADLVGSGPYRVAEWKRGEFVRLVADTTAADAAEDPAGRLALRRRPGRGAQSGAEPRGRSARDRRQPRPPGPRGARLARCASCRTPRPPTDSSGSGSPAGRRAGRTRSSRDAPTRRALALAVDRETLARSVFGREAKAPPGPMSQLLWIWSDSIRTLPFDTVQADRALEAAGWRRPDSATTRQRGSRALAFDILVPSTSATRRQLAVALQAMWQAVGAAVTVTAVDFPVFQERLGAGEFDSYIGAWLDEPSPRGLADQWTRAGWGGLNYGHYANPAFDALLRRAGRAARRGRGAPALPRGDGHAQRRRAGHLPVRAGQLGRGRAAARRGGDRSLQLDERASAVVRGALSRHAAIRR